MRATRASRIFWYFERERDGAPFTVGAPDGQTVPIFSTPERALGALPRGHGIAPVSPTQIEAFALLCHTAGARFLELDPK